MADCERKQASVVDGTRVLRKHHIIYFMIYRRPICRGSRPFCSSHRQQAIPHQELLGALQYSRMIQVALGYGAYHEGMMRPISCSVLLQCLVTMILVL